LSRPTPDNLKKSKVNLVPQSGLDANRGLNSVLISGLNAGGNWSLWDEWLFPDGSRKHPKGKVTATAFVS